jgi:hypothetical protein
MTWKPGGGSGSEKPTTRVELTTTYFTEGTMTKRGRVLRVPGDTPGLLMVEGQQFRFATDGLWKSPVPPTPGLVVDVDLDGNSRLIAVAAVADSKLELDGISNPKSIAKAIKSLAKIIATCGVMNLVAVLALIAAWCSLTNVSMQVPLVGRMDFTFWQVLGLLNKRNAIQVIDLRGESYSVGYYGCLAVVALTGPFLNCVWKDRRALLGGLAPFLFTLIIWMLARSMMQNAFAGNFSNTYADLGWDVQSEVMKVVSLGVGAYLSALAGLYFTVVAAKQYISVQSAEIGRLSREPE